MGLKTKAQAAVLATAMLVGLEGNLGKPYLDSAKVWTDCYGNTKNVSREHVRSMAECVQLLEGEVGRIARLVYTDLPNLTYFELASIISFVYNIGDNAWRNSTARRLFKAGQNAQGCAQMYRWNKITLAGVKIVLEGLNNRRKKEVAVCLGDPAELSRWASAL